MSEGIELIKTENGVSVLDTSVGDLLVRWEQNIRELKEQEQRLKDIILKEMGEKGIIKVETDKLVINYIDATTRETFDTKNFKKEYLDLYDEYCKLIDVKPSIRVRLKDGKLDD